MPPGLSRNGMVCAALIPNAVLRHLYYYGRLVPARVRFAGRLRNWIELTIRRVKAYLQRDFLWDGVGNWFYQADVQKAAEEADFEVEFRHSWFYEYRFHSLLRPIRGSDQ